MTVSAPRPEQTAPRGGGLAPGPRRREDRLLALLAAGAVALNFPLLSIFAEPGSVGGIPALLLYLFAVWAGLIAATALALRRSPPPSPPPGDGPEP